MHMPVTHWAEDMNAKVNFAQIELATGVITGISNGQYDNNTLSASYERDTSASKPTYNLYITGPITATGVNVTYVDYTTINLDITKNGVDSSFEIKVYFDE